MGTRLTRVLAVLGAVAILVVGVNAAAYAATGKSLLLGKTNKASKTTTIQNTKSGAALQLKTKSSSTAPLKVNGTGKVVNLNADKVDGLDGTAINNTANSALAKANAATTAANDVQAFRYRDATGTRPGNVSYNVGTLPKGVYSVSFNSAVRLASTGTMTCSLQYSSGFPLSFTTVLATNTVTATSTTAFVSPVFSTVLDLAGTESLKVNCTTSGGDGWTSSGAVLLSSGSTPSISFTKLDGVTNRNLAP